MWIVFVSPSDSLLNFMWVVSWVHCGNSMGALMDALWQPWVVSWVHYDNSMGGLTGALWQPWVVSWVHYDNSMGGLMGALWQFYGWSHGYFMTILAATAMVRKTFHVKNATNDVMADVASHFAQFDGTCWPPIKCTKPYIINQSSNSSD